MMRFSRLLDSEILSCTSKQHTKMTGTHSQDVMDELEVLPLVFTEFEIRVLLALEFWDSICKVRQPREAIDSLKVSIA